MTNPAALVQKLWNYCNILRDDGLSYGDYVEQLTFLLFLKMADGQSNALYLSAEKRRDAASTLQKAFTGKLTGAATCKAALQVQREGC